jgi:3-deoxy-D-manno-octulosonate 8-phosphate phosphatase (KDO 8-P phosphatase)
MPSSALDQTLAHQIRLLVLDVDGVLTDNAIYLGPVDGKRVELKRFDIQDGLGLGLLRGGPIEVVWLSGRFSEATSLRAQELRIATVIQEPGARKVPALGGLLEERGLDWSEVAFVGDDLADLGAMERVGLPIAVANAVSEVKAVARWITSKAGGHGAVREVVEALLKARGEWESAVARYRAVRETV